MVNPRLQYSAAESCNAPEAVNSAVVVVTYGHRDALLKTTVLDALRAGLQSIIVVENGTVAERPWLNALGNKASRRIVVIHLPGNTGSAGGFAAGMRKALALPETEWVWLLDDDNWLAPDAFAAIRTAELALDPDATGLVAVSAYRTDRTHHQRLAAGDRDQRVFGRENSFCAMHILDLASLPLATLRRRDSQDKDAEPPTRYAPAQYGPWGGLFLHTNLINRIGFPDERMYSDGDDIEYTLRIARSGGRLFLATDSRIRDGDESWGQQSSRRRALVSRLLAESSDKRIFCAVRNRVYIETCWRVRKRWVFYLNGLTFCILIGIFATTMRKPRRAVLILRAAAAGLRKDLT